MARRRTVVKRLVRLDTGIFRTVAHAHTPWLDRGLPLLSRAADNSRLWMAVAGLLAAAGGRSGTHAALRGLGSVAVTSAVVNQGVKRLVRRPRPDLRAVPEIRRLPIAPLTTSFPSGHAASAAAFATAVAVEKPRVAPPVAMAAAAVACSRVYVGVHYPFDVLAGAAAGGGAALLSARLWPKLPPESARRADPGERARLPASGDGAGVALVLNRASGARRGGEDGTRLAEELPGARVMTVERPEEIREVLERAAGDCDVLGVCGGDGTVAAAAEAALERRRPLLLVPAGTLNHLARDLAIERRHDVLEALQDGLGRRVDVAEAAGRTVVNTVGFGAYPDLLDARKTVEDRIGRWPAQLVALARTLRRAQPLEVEIDGRRRRVWMGFVGNCRHEPGGFAPTWRPRLDDGLLDVRLLLAEPHHSRLGLLGALLAGRLERSRAYERFETPSLELRAAAPLRLAVDGDRLDAGTSVRVAKAGRLPVYAP